MRKRRATWIPVSWIGHLVLAFTLFFLPAHFLGYWAFAIPPWLILIATVMPIWAALETITGDAGHGAMAFAAIWLFVSVFMIGMGWKRERSALVAIGGHLIVLPVAIFLAGFLAAYLNGGNLKGTS